MTQLRQLRASARSTTATITYRRKRPSSLSRISRGSSNGIQHPSTDEVSHFWEGVISVQGEWLHLDTALVEWGYHQMEARVPHDVEPVWGLWSNGLTAGWIDYQKVYDRVPYERINWMLCLMRVPLSIQYVAREVELSILCG